MNELREKIIETLKEGEPKANIADAILDVVIAALPEQVDMSMGIAVTDWTYTGDDIVRERNKTLQVVYDILQSAKEQT